MPKISDDHSERLVTAVRAAVALMPTLEKLMAEPEGAGPQTGTIGRSAPESSEPWAHRAAEAYWDIYFGARVLAGAMRKSIGLRLPLFDDAFGVDAFDVMLRTAPTVPDLVLKSATRQVEKWVDRARQIPAIDETEAWTPVPVVPGSQPPECPYCRTFSLRMLRRRGEVRCFFPDCRDADGKPTRARMESGRMTGEARLIFGDGTTMYCRELGDGNGGVSTRA